MKLHFEADLPYQSAAIQAVADLFNGQEICRTEFTVTVRAARWWFVTEQGGMGKVRGR